jgi:mannan endo-1,4-beta-mannosidase
MNVVNCPKMMESTMNRRLAILLLSVLGALTPASPSVAEVPVGPVTREASPEAKALLELLYNISGKFTLTGQHNYPNTKDASTRDAAEYGGKTPAVYSQDWGFAADGDKDSYLARPAIVDEVKRQYQLGSIITICWHAAPPTANEPVVFRARRREGMSLESVQGRLTDEEFQSVLTPGTALHAQWCSQVDAIAGHLKQLQEARVPILWRPYHEMNGDWFWWGGRREGLYTTKALYRQLFDRFVRHHQLTNLVWVWSVDRPEGETRQYADYFPGADYFDVASLDCYGEFKQSYYEDLLSIAGGKPVILGEVGVPPVAETLAQQPNWGLYVIWAEMSRRAPQERLRALVNHPRVLSLEDPAYREAIAPLRAASGLPPLGPVE